MVHEVHNCSRIISKVAGRADPPAPLYSRGAEDCIESTVAGCPGWVALGDYVPDWELALGLFEYD